MAFDLICGCMEILNFGGVGVEGFEICSERLTFDLICFSEVHLDHE